MTARHRATRLGWAEESRARKEVTAACAGSVSAERDVEVRQLHDGSWAVRWPSGVVTGRYGTIHPTEVQWYEPTRVTFEVTLELSEKERKAIGRALGKRYGKASDADVIHWARAELGLAILELGSEEP